MNLISCTRHWSGMSPPKSTPLLTEFYIFSSRQGHGNGNDSVVLLRGMVMRMGLGMTNPLLSLLSWSAGKYRKCCRDLNW